MKRLFSCGILTLLMMSGLMFTPATVAQFGGTIGVGGIEVPGADKAEIGSGLLDSARTAINWVLGFLATIALVLCLRGGFQMVTAAGNDSKFKKGGAIIKNAAIGIAIILLSWLIVSLVFWLVNLFTTTG